MNRSSLNGAQINGTGSTAWIVNQSSPVSVGAIRTLQPAQWSWFIPTNYQINTLYRCILDGAIAEGLSPLILPMSSFQSRLRSGTPSYLGIIVPNATLFASHVIARAGGTLSLEKGARFQDGTIFWQSIVAVPLEGIRYDTGGRSSSLTLSGHITQTNTNVKTLEIEKLVSESLQATGKRRIRTGDVDFQLRPGDTVMYGGTSWTVGLISLAVGDKYQYMDITEAD